MEVLKIIDNLKDLLIKYTSNSESLLEEELNLIFNKIENINFKEDIDNYAEFVLLGASLFEIKAKRLLPQEEEICLLYTSPSPRDVEESRMPSSA